MNEVEGGGVTEKGSQRESRSQGPEAVRTMVPSRDSHVLSGWNPEWNGEAATNEAGLEDRGPGQSLVT